MSRYPRVGTSSATFYGALIAFVALAVAVGIAIAYSGSQARMPLDRGTPTQLHSLPISEVHPLDYSTRFVVRSS